ncbi:hypothetical protein PF008_g7349 [Phytophthora fragariae]|uniref:HTH CENPB-type domain-containing protein n=1 Tax=Phytophthora fragariae TaxID=53985 RepID=A0A6G0S2Q3_9STRA|nr:hypothetical protein PF008_g7349 [Phytophthora fragariae]
MATPAPRSFQKRVRLTKLQELQIGKHRHDQPSAMLAELATWTQAEFSLAIKPSKQLVARALLSERRLGHLSTDCPRRRNKRPRIQLLLDQSIIEYVKACEEMQLALSGVMMIARAKWALHRLEIPPSAWPRLGKSWL